MAPLLSVRNITLRRDDGSGSAILNDVCLDVEEGEVVMIRGPSGCGKTTFLKCVAELNVYQKGEVLLRGKASSEYGIPHFRTLVQYIPQRPSLLPGTPLDLLQTIRSYSSRRKTPPNPNFDPMELAAEWGVDKVLWTREWATLSGGEAQRVALAIGVGVGGAEVVLLDEPTSALDEATMQKVEKSLISMLPPLKTRPSREQDGVQRKGTGPKAFLWITHEGVQAERVGTRTFELHRNS